MKQTCINSTRFNEAHPRYGPFCVGSPYAIRIDEVTWPTDRHYLLAMQYPGCTERIRSMPLSGEELPSVEGKGPSERVKWDVVRDDYLERALRAKFSQHLDLEALLQETGEAHLVYMSRADSYYGIGHDGRGQNMFGRLLVRVRRRLSGAAAACFEEPEDVRDPMLERYEERARRSPEDPDEWGRLAEAYIAFNMPERASAAAHRALVLDPERVLSRIVLGRALLGCARYREAVEHLRFVVRNDPADPNFLRLLAEAYRGIGRNIAAKLLESRARRLKSSSEEE